MNRAVILGVLCLCLAALFGYMFYNIHELTTHPCRLCMEQFKYVRCYPMTEGDIPRWQAEYWEQMQPSSSA